MNIRHFSFLLLLSGCTSFTNKDLIGLWELDDAKVDAMRINTNPTFLKFNANNSFSLSRPTGGMSGIYRIGNTRLEMESTDKKWFNTDWRIDKVNEFIFLEGIEYGFRTTKLRFRRIDKIPDFKEFEDQLIGSWELYLIMTKGQLERTYDTWFRIDKEGNYNISTKNGVIESGQSIINRRHRKIIFKKDDSHWNISYFGKELRLYNKSFDIQYHLRKESR